MQLESKPKSGAAALPQSGQQRWLRPKYILAAFIATFLYVTNVEGDVAFGTTCN